LDKAHCIVNAHRPTPIEIDASTYARLHNFASLLVRREGRNPSIEASDLLHEAWLRLAKYDCIDAGRTTALYLTVMPRILVDLSRQRNTHKRFGGLKQIGLDAVQTISYEPAISYASREVLDLIASTHKRRARALVMRFWYGLTIREIATELSISDRTVKRDLKDGQLRFRKELMKPKGREAFEERPGRAQRLARTASAYSTPRQDSPRAAMASSELGGDSSSN
jgi:RNA polymerase sigma factor (sigma-70 family)